MAGAHLEGIAQVELGNSSSPVLVGLLVTSQDTANAEGV